MPPLFPQGCLPAARRAEAARPPGPLQGGDIKESFHPKSQHCPRLWPKSRSLAAQKHPEW
jgi:hypothetical protein